MSHTFQKVAVLGAGVMGQGIAAHLANARIPSVLYDISIETAQKGLQQAVKLQPAGKDTSLFYHPSGAEQITAATYDEEGARLLGECDLIIEVVVERLDIKHKVFDWVATHRKSGSIVASNTSGLSVADMTSSMAPELRERFLVMHFFNPVRYMRLLELVAGEDTLPEVMQRVADFGQRQLGKGIVYGKDTPNFVANRLGVYGILSVFHHMDRLGMNPKEVDAVCGRPMGRPNSAVFRTGDLVGLDTLAHTVKTMYEGCEGDEQRERFVIPDWLQVMLDEGALGEKSGRGFFKKIKRAGKSVILTRDLKTGEYVELEKPRFDSVKAAKKGGVKALVAGDDKAAQLAWSATVDSLLYAATRLPEIADDIVNIDRAMRWGFAWDRGPFEGWDDLGVAESVARMQGEGHEVPGWVLQMLEAGRESFYARDESGALTYWDHISASAQPIPTPSTWLQLDELKQRGGSLKSNDSASLYDLGDGVLGLRFHSKMNALDSEIFALYQEALDQLDAGKWEGLVLGNQGGRAFCAGANIFVVLAAAGSKAWDQIETMVSGMQQTVLRAQRSTRPVVTAPWGLTLGGGLEVAMQSSACVATGELYAGLVEVGVGLIPAGGGCKELLYRYLGSIPEGVDYDPNPFVQKAFERIGMAKVATSGEQARAMGFLRPHDPLCMDPDAQVQQAKRQVLGMVQAGYTPAARGKIKLPGPSGRSAIELFLMQMGQGGFATPHDLTVGKRLAYILTGGDVPSNTWVDEQHLLDLEREAFLSLCGEKKTQERIMHMLQTGKPLRN